MPADVSYGSAEPRRLLVVIPNWVGDVVLATPVLAALRRTFAHAQVTFLMRRYVGDILDGCGWHDEAVYWPARGRSGGALTLVKALRGWRFDLALLLTNSFRSAAVCWLAGARRRVGYARDARTLLLTDRLRAPREDGQFVPHPMIDYYRRLAEHIGAAVPDSKLCLGITAEQERQGAALKQRYRLGDGQPYAVINPGAAFGAAKCWLPERFSRVCDELAARWGFASVIVGAAGETALMRAIAAGAATPVICCDDPRTTLGSLKPIVRDAALLVCNDTGPRHYGNAFDVPTVTIFGPTFQEWTDTGYEGEIKLQVPVECGPCMLRRCPLDHRCMTSITADMVLDSAARLLERRRR